MFKKHERFQTSIETIERTKTATEQYNNTTTEASTEPKSHEALEGKVNPSREIFQNTMIESVNQNGETVTERKYKTLTDLWKDFIPENLEDYESSVAVAQILETKSFVTSIKEYSEQTQSDILSIGYTDDGTFYVTLTEGRDQDRVSVVRMNPLDGQESEEIIGQGVEIENHYNRQTHDRSASVQVKDSLGEDIKINLSVQGNSVLVGSEEKLLRYAGDLDHKLDYQFPMTQEGRLRQSNNQEFRRRQEEMSELHLNDY